MVPLAEFAMHVECVINHPCPVCEKWKTVLADTHFQHSAELCPLGNERLMLIAKDIMTAAEKPSPIPRKRSPMRAADPKAHPTHDDRRSNRTEREDRNNNDKRSNRTEWEDRNKSGRSRSPRQRSRSRDRQRDRSRSGDRSRRDRSRSRPKSRSQHFRPDISQVSAGSPQKHSTNR